MRSKPEIYLQVLFNAVLENACSEQGARMSAMDSSSRNAGEMLDRLTLTYNRFYSSLVAYTICCSLCVTNIYGLGTYCCLVLVANLLALVM